MYQICWDCRITSKGLMISLEGVAVGLEVILKVNENVVKEVMTVMTDISMHVVAFAITLSIRAAMLDSATTSCFVQNILTTPADARAVGLSKYSMRTSFNISRQVFDDNHATSNGRSSMLPPSLRESSSTTVVNTRARSLHIIERIYYAKRAI